MPTTLGLIQGGRLVLTVSIAPPAEAAQPTGRLYQALLDTGAEMTLITSRVAQEIGLIPIDVTHIMPVSGVPIPAVIYRVRLDIPIGNEYRGWVVDVAELPYNPEHYDVLLGMDVIAAGLHITLFGTNFLLST